MPGDNSLRNIFLYMGLTRQQYRSVQPRVAEKCRQNLIWTSMVMCFASLIMIVLDSLIFHQGFYSYFLVVAVAGLIIHLVSRKIKKPKSILILSYLVLAFLFSFAIAVTASPANANVPATSIIVYMVLFPMLIPDVAWRMLILVSSFEGLFLLVSHTVKSQEIFHADLSNSMVLVPLGFFVFILVSNTLAKQIWESLQMQKIETHMIISLTDIIEGRDAYTGDHVRNTEDYVIQILRQLRLNPKYKDIITDQYVKLVARSAPLHDIGKIKIPDTILNKPGRLTEEEFAVMKTHTTYGAELVDEILYGLGDPKLTEVAKNIARDHHERMDGNGYPAGKKGDEIPLEARIMAVADVYDALVSERVYKKPFSKEEALAIMKDGRGTQFDADVLDAFLAVTE
ncbi:MAG: HD-GYP domain-containing protein [Candidatus Limivicinus sp.]